jgi:sulfur relay protein TusB/DsrH
MKLGVIVSDLRRTENTFERLQAEKLGVILVQNGIYHAVLTEKGETSPVLGKEGAEFYAVKEDLESRGFGEGDVDGKVKVITYGDFVDLIMNDYEKTAWL